MGRIEKIKITYHRIRLFFIILFFILASSGCATNNGLQNKVDTIVNDKFENKVIFPKDEDLADCDKLKLLTGKKFGDLYEYATVTLQKQYEVCANKQKELSNFIKEVYKK